MKKAIAGLLITALVTGSCTGGIYLYNKNKRENTVVEVIPVSNISTMDWGSTTNMSGRVVNNQRQQIYVTSTQKIAEVFVKDGQEVKIGDPLMQLDTTMDTLELQNLSIKIEKKKLEIANGSKRLDKLLNTKPAPSGGWGDIPGDGGWYEDEGGYTEEESSEEESSEEVSSEEESSESESSSSEESSESESSSSEESSEVEPSSPEESSGVEPSSPEESSGVEPSSPEESSGVEPSSPEESSTAEPSSPEESSAEGTTEVPTDPPTEPPTEKPTDPVSADGKVLIGGTLSSTDQKYSGSGIKEDPYMFLCSYSAALDYKYVSSLVKSKTYAVIRIYNEAGVPDYDMDLSALITSEAGEPIIHTHEYTAISQTAPNCVAKGVTVYQCSGCGDTYREEQPATGVHDYQVISQGENLKYIMYQCSVCGNVIVEANPGYVEPTSPPSTEFLPPVTTEEIGNTATIKTVLHTRSMSAAPEVYQEEDFSGYSAEELSKEIKQQQQTLRDADLERRKMELEYQKKEKKLVGNGVISSTVNGVIEGLQEVDNIEYSKPFMIVNGGSGLYITGSVAEDMLETFTPGRILECQAWTNDGNMINCQAEVTEVSEYPDDNNRYDSQNGNMTFYPYVACINGDEAAGLSNGDWIDISLNSDGNADALFIEMMYVRKDSTNQYYVWAQNPETKLLERRNVSIGKTLYDSYYEIKSGLTVEDRIAVPYGKNISEGVMTVCSDDEDAGQMPDVQEYDEPSGSDALNIEPMAEDIWRPEVMSQEEGEG